MKKALVASALALSLMVGGGVASAGTTDVKLPKRNYEQHVKDAIKPVKQGIAKKKKYYKQSWLNKHAYRLWW